MSITPRFSTILYLFAAACALTLLLPAARRAAADDLPGTLQPRIFLPALNTSNPAPVDGLLQGARMPDAAGQVEPVPDDYIEPIDTAWPDDIEEDIDAAPGASSTYATRITYYVDCAAGNDANPGRAPLNAWRTLPKANQATLNPGDQLLLKRGCTFPALLDARWFGTAAQPILIGAYGAGDLPIIQNPDAIDVRITGAYQIIENLHATGPAASTNCTIPSLTWKVGFEFKNGAANNTLRRSQASHNAIGIRFSHDAHDNHILRNTIIRNDQVWDINALGYAQGAVGILLHGNNQEVAHNYFADNRTPCAYNGDPESISVEVYNARNSRIHHNISYDRVFAEMGSSPTLRAQDNLFAYNLHVAIEDSSVHGARFLITRGWGDPYGPVLNTIVLHNTVYITGNKGKGVTCWPCGPDILTMRNNLLWVDPEPFSANLPFVESHNLYWSTNGVPLLNWRNGLIMSLTSKVAKPKFLDPATGNFGLSAGSPARDAGTLDALPADLSYDLAGLTLPIGPQADIGAYEYYADPWRLTTIPGRIEAENYKAGGEGVGYHDTGLRNIGGAYRQDGVDIQPTRDTTGVYNVGWIAAGEWLAYEINAPAPGAYRIIARVAAPLGNSRFNLKVDGVNLTGSVPIPATGGWHNWIDLPLNVTLDYGRHTLRFTAETKGFNLNYLDLTQN